jgi:hypothetical protein
MLCYIAVGADAVRTHDERQTELYLREYHGGRIWAAPGNRGLQAPNEAILPRFSFDGRLGETIQAWGIQGYKNTTSSSDIHK